MIDRKNDRDHVAWDIETTGFAWSDEITVIGFWFPGGHTELVVNTDGETFWPDHIRRALEETSGGVSVSVTGVESERELLESTREVLFDRFEREYNRLVAFNAESWKSGFDLPFLRTRCLQHDVDWVFDGIQFADLWDPIKKRINTTHTVYGKSVSVNSLTGAHALLLQREVPCALELEFELETDHPWYCNTQYDPFEDSGSAVDAYRRGDLLPIAQHNLADIHRTWELGELVRMFVSSKDISTKKL